MLVKAQGLMYALMELCDTAAQDKTMVVSELCGMTLGLPGGREMEVKLHEESGQILLYAEVGRPGAWGRNVIFGHLLNANVMLAASSGFSFSYDFGRNMVGLNALLPDSIEKSHFLNTTNALRNAVENWREQLQKWNREQEAVARIAANNTALSPAGPGQPAMGGAQPTMLWG